MTESEIANHTLELLRPMSARIDTIAFDIVDIKARMANVEESPASMSVRIASAEVTVAGFGKRMDRIEVKLDRIERRLELRDGAED